MAMNRIGKETHALVIALALMAGIASAAEPSATSAPMITSAPLPLEITSGTLAPQMTTGTAALVAELQQIRFQMIPAQQALSKDPDIRALAEGVRKAQEALARATEEALNATTDTARLRAHLSTLQSEITSTALSVEQRRDAFRRYHDVYLKMRILEQEARNKPNVTALAAVADKAGVALEAVMNGKLRSNPQTARLIARRDEIEKELDSLRKRPPSPDAGPTTFPLTTQPGSRPLVPTPTPAPTLQAGPTTVPLTSQIPPAPIKPAPVPAP